MRILKNNILLLLLVVSANLSTYAQTDEEPPQPAQRGIPTPPAEPIDENIILLGLVAVLFGSYTIYKTYKPTKKASN